MQYLKDNKDPVKLLADGSDSSLYELMHNDDRYYELTVKPEDIMFVPKG